MTLTDISIHALRVEGDHESKKKCPGLRISIHALRVEGDSKPFTFCHLNKNFYPRPPGGGRLVPDACLYNAVIFLSTPSGWRATIFSAPARGIDKYFYPRPPGGGRRNA